MLSAALAVSACATLAPGPGEVAAVAAKPFDLSGRVLVSYDGRAFSSGIRWRHTSQRDEIWLMSPVGQALAYIDAVATGATLTAADQTQYSAANVDSLTRRALGWVLPLAQLQYWVRGEAAPSGAPESVMRDASSKIVALTQHGWHIEFLYYPLAEHGGLPRRLDLTQGGNQMRMVIDTWRDMAAP